ncbi:hypothetical protein ACGFZQ_39225 [Streptomyces sp. NPDC048254]|uniref:hypothetical protein n=1 Tax=Streptomyces sp. NPDC048254 TaxID=3365525 RepID=UPI0037115D93
MTTAPMAAGAAERWRSPIDLRRYDRSPVLSTAEQDAIRELGVRNLRRLRHHDPDAPQWAEIGRLLRPLQDVNASFDTPPNMHTRRAMHDAAAVLLLRSADVGRTFWGWSEQDWLDFLGRNHRAYQEQVPAWAEGYVRPFLCGHAYHLGAYAGFRYLGHFDRLSLACRDFGRRLVEEEIARVRTVLTGWGYQYGKEEDKGVPSVVSQLFLLSRSPHTGDLTTPFFDPVRREELLTDGGMRVLHAVQRAVAALGFCDPPATVCGADVVSQTGVPPVWAAWAERWNATTTMTHRSRLHVRAALLKTGRWIAAQQPQAADPAAWTRQTCTAWIAAVDRMEIGDHVVRTSSFAERLGQPLQAASKAGLIRSVRVFFRDLPDWEWLRPGFDHSVLCRCRAASPPCSARTHG